MPSFLSNKRLIILLVSLILLVAVIGITLKERPQPTWIEQFLRDSIGMIQSIAYKPARSVAGFFESIIEIKHLYTENQELKKNLQEHAMMVAKIKELEAENNSLKDLLKVESQLGKYELRAAEVVMRSPDRWHQQVTINKGEKHGIQPNMSVITSEGLVGRVKSVSQFTAVVELVSDVNRSSYISAVVQGNELVYGVIEGYDLEKEALHFRKIPIEAPLEVGQTVITSGLGGIFPRGLFIGQVIEVTPNDYGLTQSALIRPAANLYHLDYLFIVERAFDPSTAIKEEGERKEEEGGEVE